MFFTNKHVVAALIIAPILAILSYFGIDRMVSEKPHAAQAGESYALASKPNCHYSSGQCELKNGSFELTINPIFSDDGLVTLQLTSNEPLSSAHYAVANASGTESQPQSWAAANDDGTVWTTSMLDVADEQQLQLVVNASDTLFYGETGLAFIHYETSFHRDFRQP
ncbi:hypothetical protein [Halioxenophilus sp. WMMB6]|uniref:hypothetical protein n=1 Tax=Halioxenophilus sp. WMMB6 TaxID=3073815 RepID=UPI00295E64DF|nr:hypothetical protein [Halioxenophilus sp. WMMB6]